MIHSVFLALRRFQTAFHVQTIIKNGTLGIALSDVSQGFGMIFLRIHPRVSLVMFYPVASVFSGTVFLAGVMQIPFVYRVQTGLIRIVTSLVLACSRTPQVVLGVATMDFIGWATSVCDAVRQVSGMQSGNVFCATPPLVQVGSIEGSAEFSRILHAFLASFLMRAAYFENAQGQSGTLGIARSDAQQDFGTMLLSTLPPPFLLVSLVTIRFVR